MATRVSGAVYYDYYKFETTDKSLIQSKKMILNEVSYIPKIPNIAIVKRQKKNFTKFLMLNT